MAWTFYSNGIAKTGSNAALDNIGDVDVFGASDGSLLRYDSTGEVWSDTSTLIYDDNGQLQLTNSGSSAGIEIGGDVHLFRSQANRLETNDTLKLELGASGGLPGLLVTQNVVGTGAIGLEVTGDSQNRFVAFPDGSLEWGSGAGARDVRLSRAAANILALGAGDKIQQNATPVSADDLTNKAYVDAVAHGMDWKASVRATTTANITLSGGQTIDGVAVVAGDRVLVKDQTTASQNGIYTVAAGAWSRSTDANSDDEVSAGMSTFVSEGTSQGSSTWTLTSADPITLGSTSLTFAQVAGAETTPLNALSDVDTTGVVDGSLLRYEATGTQWNDTTTLLYTDAGQLRASTTGSGAGILIGGDFQIYRSAANIGSLGAGDKIQADPLATTANDLTNQVYVDRVNFFMGT